MDLKPYLISLAIGLLVGVLYALLNTRSPAPPIIALLGLLGMLLGESLTSWAKSQMSFAKAAEHCLHAKGFSASDPGGQKTQACDRRAT
jgi:XapX domain-containing protein